jgi:pSer/pThr/pTyr-binding forkhead associated (FHA) protein
MNNENFPKLTIRNNKKVLGELFINEKGKKYTIGRSSENDLSIDNPVVSKYHFSICLDWDNLLIAEDLNSKNGLYLNGKRISRAIEIYSNDVLNIGSLEVTISDSLAPENKASQKRDSHCTKEKNRLARLCLFAGAMITVIPLIIFIWIFCFS